MTAERKTSYLGDSPLTALPRVPQQQQQLREGTQPCASFLALGVFDLVGIFKKDTPKPRTREPLWRGCGERATKQGNLPKPVGLGTRRSPWDPSRDPPSFDTRLRGPAALHRNPNCTSNPRCTWDVGWERGKKKKKKDIC